MQQLNYIPRGFCQVTMVADEISSKTRAKDVMVLPVEDPVPGQTHQLQFYDCGCGSIRQIPGVVTEAAEGRVVFTVSAEKRFIIEKLEKP
jgi:hypothetical protein